MPWQLLYTSAPRGLVPGQSGYCTVARSRDLREGLIPRLEKLSYYTPEANHNPVISAHRILELRGVRYHVLTRLVEAGLDFTKRRKFIAHHLIFDPAELATLPSPAAILLNWKGWLDQWEGEPQWLEQLAPLPTPSAPTKHWRALAVEPRALLETAQHDAWITGTQEDRKLFLPLLDESLRDTPAPWDITFTNCFQPGDLPADFKLKAAWPNTPGFEAATKIGAEPQRLRELRATPIASHIAPPPTPAPSTTPVIDKKNEPRPRPISIWPWLAGAATALVLVAAIYFRNRSSVQAITPEPNARIAPHDSPKSNAPRARLIPSHSPIKIDDIFDGNPLWLARAENGPLGPAPEFEKLFQLLRDSELFGKDIKATLQNARTGAKIAAVVDAQPNEHKIVFKNGPAEIELLSNHGALILRSNDGDPTLLEISQQRILTIPFGAPLKVSADRIVLEPRSQLASLDADFQDHLAKIILPKGTQLALRPQKDSLAAQETIFGITPSLSFDLGAIHRQVNRIVREKGRETEALRRELNELRASERSLTTNAKTPEEIQRGNRLAELREIVPKATQELRALREKASAIPENLTKIDRYALFLCQSNVNTEIIRFGNDAKAPRLTP